MPPDPRRRRGLETELHMPLAHLYRGEMQRMTVWRQRLDVTSNWAIVLATGLTTFTLGRADVPHYTLLLGLGLIGFSILLEGRRYRHLYHSKWRLYLIEFGYFAEVLNPSGALHLPEWRALLAADLRHARFMVSWITAIRLRLRRNYLLLLYFISSVWLVKLFIHPTRAQTVHEVLARLPVGHIIPAWFVASTAVVFLVTATVMAVTCPPAEKLEDWSRRYARLRKDRGVGEDEVEGSGS